MWVLYEYEYFYFENKDILTICQRHDFPPLHFKGGGMEEPLFGP